jgi:hypothetical protein
MRTTSKFDTVFDAKPVNGLVRSVCKCLLLLPVTGALASPFDANIQVQAEVLLAAPGPNSSQTAASGASVDKTFALTAGALPVGGRLTDINDGVGMNFTSNAAFNGSSPSRSQELDGNYALQITNTSALDTFKLTLGMRFDNQQNASGPATNFGAFTHGVATLFAFDPANNPGVDLAFSDLTSDTLLGNNNNGSTPGSSGGPVNEARTAFLEFIMSPNSTLNLGGRNDLFGSAGQSGAAYTGLLNSFVFVSNVANQTNPPSNVPVPASLWLFVSGLMAFGTIHRSPKRAKANSLTF